MKHPLRRPRHLRPGAASQSPPATDHPLHSGGQGRSPHDVLTHARHPCGTCDSSMFLWRLNFLLVIPGMCTGSSAAATSASDEIATSDIGMPGGALADVSGVGGPVACEVALPGDSNVDVPAEGSGEDRGGDLGGELEERGVAVLAGPDAEVAEHVRGDAGVGMGVLADPPARSPGYAARSAVHPAARRTTPSRCRRRRRRVRSARSARSGRRRADRPPLDRRHPCPSRRRPFPGGPRSRRRRDRGRPAPTPAARRTAA